MFRVFCICLWMHWGQQPCSSWVGLLWKLNLKSFPLLRTSYCRRLRTVIVRWYFRPPESIQGRALSIRTGILKQALYSMRSQSRDVMISQQLVLADELPDAMFSRHVVLFQINPRSHKIHDGHLCVCNNSICWLVIDKLRGFCNCGYFGIH